MTCNLCPDECNGNHPDERRECIGCGAVALLLDDLCGACWQMADELDREFRGVAIVAIVIDEIECSTST